MRAGAEVVGEPHGAELTGEGGRGRGRGERMEAEPEQGAAWSLQLHAGACVGPSVHTCMRVKGHRRSQFILMVQRLLL